MKYMISKLIIAQNLILGFICLLFGYQINNIPIMILGLGCFIVGYGNGITLQIKDQNA